MGNHSSSKSLSQPVKPHPDVDTIVDYSFGLPPVYKIRSAKDETKEFQVHDFDPKKGISMTVEREDDMYDAVSFFCYAHQQQAPPENVTLQEISPIFGQGPMDPYKKALTPTGTTPLAFRGRLVLITFGKELQLTVFPNLALQSQIARRRDAHEFLLALMAAISDYRQAHDVSTSHVRVLTNHGERWRNNNRVTPRPLQTVCLPAGQKEAILADIETFRQNVGKLQQLGLPAKRGYMLSGLPGTGKSSLVMALSAHFKYKICVLSLAEDELNDSTLPQLIQDMPENSALIIEDIDRMSSATTNTVHHPKKKSKKDSRPVSSSLSMSCLLSVLDGLLSDSNGQIVFFTTNHPEVLDEALMRPGRVDYHLKLGYADRSQLQAIASIFWPNDPKVVEKITSFYREQLTPATIMSRLVTLMNLSVDELLDRQELTW